MSHPLNNPFLRGYHGLTIQRFVTVQFDERAPKHFPLHPTQSHLRDDQVKDRACIFTNDFVFITEGQAAPDDRDIQDGISGVASPVVHAVMADEAGQPCRVADTYSHEEASEVVRRLQFETGFYSRCWEISTAHITDAAMRYLRAIADLAVPTGLLFEAFHVPSSDAVGVKLISTPWTDANLLAVVGHDAKDLRRQQARLPESLQWVLRLAALADTRILVFDPSAPVLTGLPVFEED
ncbi:DUF5983 family protein [Chitinimonas koreensis]|uniref:DUF5983 family protein n=1 Tax=Chitinimonas koreensis TaxID=356302 RepID=UPI0004274C3D|nr:hypothetical protein [Chitinimonas koreensis]QNM96738.1 ABC transporter substrate-binding protein [Chitinimonas koreensis]